MGPWGFGWIPGSFALLDPVTMGFPLVLLALFWQVALAFALGPLGPFLGCGVGFCPWLLRFGCLPLDFGQLERRGPWVPPQVLQQWMCCSLELPWGYWRAWGGWCASPISPCSFQGCILRSTGVGFRVMIRVAGVCGVDCSQRCCQRPLCSPCCTECCKVCWGQHGCYLRCCHTCTVLFTIPITSWSWLPTPSSGQWPLGPSLWVPVHHLPPHWWLGPLVSPTHCICSWSRPPAPHSQSYGLSYSPVESPGFHFVEVVGHPGLLPPVVDNGVLDKWGGHHPLLHHMDVLLGPLPDWPAGETPVHRLDVILETVETLGDCTPSRQHWLPVFFYELLQQLLIGFPGIRLQLLQLELGLACGALWVVTDPQVAPGVILAQSVDQLHSSSLCHPHSSGTD